MRRGLIYLIPLVLVLTAGCTSTGIINVVKTLPQVQEFLEVYPDAELRVSSWNLNYSRVMLDEIRGHCGDQMIPKEYYYVVVSKEGINLSLWMDKNSYDIECLITKGYNSNFNEVRRESISCTDFCLSQPYEDCEGILWTISGTYPRCNCKYQCSNPIGCLPEWNCTDWSACTRAGFMNRSCTDLNHCNNSYNKPLTTASCAYQCIEGWVCSDWSACNNYNLRYRSCTDVNECGTNLTKPNLMEGCVYSPPSCTPSWQCNLWSPCINGFQYRICYDSNNCNNTQGKPNEVQSCLCTPQWDCNLWGPCINGTQSRVCYDLHSCGTTQGIPLTTQSCVCNNTCQTNSQCNDGNPCTVNVCDNPDTCYSQCITTQITSAINGDGCCLPGHYIENDTDCLSCSPGKINCSNGCVIPNCTINAQCDDANPKTIDVCVNPNLCNAYCHNYIDYYDDFSNPPYSLNTTKWIESQGSGANKMPYSVSNLFDVQQSTMSDASVMLTMNNFAPVCGSVIEFDLLLINGSNRFIRTFIDSGSQVCNLGDTHPLGNYHYVIQYYPDNVFINATGASNMNCNITSFTLPFTFRIEFATSATGTLRAWFDNVTAK